MRIVGRTGAWTCALLVAAGIASSSPATPWSHAQEGEPAYELVPGTEWSAGDVTTTVEKQIEGRSTTLSTGDDVLNADAEHVSVASTIVRKVLEVDDDGAVVRCVVHVASWSRTEDGEESTDLTGAQIEVSGQGADRTWTALTDASGWSDATRAWVDREYGPRKRASTSFAEDMSPGRPVRVGEEWTPSVGSLLRRLGSEAAAEVEATARLVRVGELDGARTAWIEFEVRIPFPTPPGVTVEWTDGGFIEVSGTGTMPLEPRAIGEEGRARAGAKARGRFTAGGRELDLAIDAELDIETKRSIGGVIPDLPPSETAGEDAGK